MAFTALLLAPAAHAQFQSAGGDPRLQSVVYDPSQIVRLRGTLGYQLTVELSSDEQIQNIAIGDSAAWQVSINRRGDHLFVKPIRADVSTNMTVITNIRVYNFELLPLPEPTSDMPWNIQFRYPAPRVEETSSQFVNVSSVLRRTSRYRVTGDRMVRPVSISDDGVHTYLRWPADRPIPAVYELAANGDEQLVNGGMRGDEYVIDSVAVELVFRIDRWVARANRIPRGKEIR